MNGMVSVPANEWSGVPDRFFAWIGMRVNFSNGREHYPMAKGERIF